ncbi:unnamed protein product [Adineta ricciae]|uniref:Acyltransferase 3 domain-containing protein n=1 Tax=Adineta ricciae TaxID=249248 RepID=A0A814JAW0_ADIRI|nr:unnamed protein product [Adineta ricciae]CAF1035553.1 unnamed protein product [Adineta ricciae]
MRHKEMDILKAFGILYVLGIHYYLPPIFANPYRSSVLSMFFFISGCFFKSFDGFRAKLIYCANKTRDLILPYFLYQILFTIICYILQRYLAIQLLTTYYRHDLLQYPVVCLLKPVFGGMSNVLGISWFISDLWLILILVQFVYRNKESSLKIDLVYLVCFLFLALVNIQWSYTSPRQATRSALNIPLPLLDHPMPKLIIVRTSFGLFFFFSGIVYRTHIEKYQHVIFTEINFCLVYIAFSQLVYQYSANLTTHQFNAEFSPAPFWLHVTTTTLSIYMFIYIAKCASKQLANNGLWVKIGQETYHIMCQHLMIFQLLNILMITIFHDGNLQVLSANLDYKYKAAARWPIYIGFGLLIPTFSAIYVRRLIRNRLFRWQQV